MRFANFKQKLQRNLYQKILSFENGAGICKIHWCWCNFAFISAAFAEFCKYRFWFSWGPSVVAFSPNFIDLRSLLSVSPPLRSVGTSPLSLVGFFIYPGQNHEAWTNALEHYGGVLHIRKSEKSNPLYQEIRTKETLVFYSNSIYIRMPPTWSWTGNYRSVLCLVFVDTLHLSRGNTE